MAGAVLALVGGFHSGVLAVVLGAAAVAGCVLLVRRGREVQWLPEGLDSRLVVVALVPAGATMVLLSTPPVMYDVLHYHLAFPEQWLLHGGFVEFPREAFSYYSSAHGIVYAFALSTVGAWGANAIHWWMAGLATLAAATLGQRFGGPSATVWSALCFACTPAVLEIADYAIADHAVAAWAGAALVALTAPDEQWPFARRLGAVAWLGGSAAAAKYLALGTVVLPLALATGLVWARGARGLRVRSGLVTAAVFVLVVAIPVAPWMGRNLVWTGNPVYPYAASLFGGPPSELDLATELDRTDELPDTLGARVAGTVGATVWRTFSPRTEGGILGAHWLLLLPVAALVRGVRTRLRTPLWAATLAGAMVWGATVHYARFLLPALLPAAALAGAAAAALTTEAPSRVTRRAFTLLLIVVFAWNGTSIASNLNLDRLSVVAGRLPESRFSERWYGAAGAAGFIRETLPGSARILLIAEARSFGIRRPVVVEDPYRTPLLVELAAVSASVEGLREKVLDLGVTHLLVNEPEMTRFAAVRGVSDYFSGAGPGDRAVIAEFLKTQVELLYSEGGVWVGRIRTDRQEDTDRSPDPSTDSLPGGIPDRGGRTTPGIGRSR